MQKNYERTELSSSIVAIGNRTNKIEFERYISQKGIKDKYKLELAKNQFYLPVGFSESDINSLLNTSPIITYVSETHNYIVTLIFPETKISIINKNFKENDNQDFELFVKTILDDSISKIQAIGINYNSIFRKANKLKIFNKKIEDTEFFKKNISFSVTIPSKYDDGYEGTYTIEKIPQENENETESRMYAFSVNYNFNLKNYDSKYKCENIPKYIDDSSKKLYELFVDTYDEFLALDYE